MDQPIPEWITNDFLAQCLRKEKGNKDIIVTNLTLSPAAPPGNNYGSFITRAKVKYKDNTTDTMSHSTSLIIKAELTHGPLKELSSQNQLNEPLFYNRFIPAANKFTNVCFAPKCFFSPKPNVTILEDLKEQGFLMADRAKQLDFDHCHHYMKAAALFHAISVAVYKEHPELLEPIKKPSDFSDDSTMKPVFQIMMKYGLKCLAEATEGVRGFKKYSELIRDSIPKIWDLVVEAHNPHKFLNTIRQGDSWITNMMFKYNKEGKVCDIKIIDFQGTSYGSPINDLVFFIWTSANNDVKKDRLKELYRIYIDNMNENLKKFNCSERITYQQLEEEVERLTPVALFAVTCLPNLFYPKAIDYDLIFSKEAKESQLEHFFRKNYTQHYCENYLPALLEGLEVNGVFNFLKSKMALGH